jgi:DNA-binding MarR family transcriptional regulator
MSLNTELDDIENGLLLLFRASFHHKGWEQLQQRAGITIDRAGASLLKVIEQSPRQHCRMLDIANYLGIEAPSVTRKVQQLEHDGLLRRKADQTDARVSNLLLTTRGRRQIAKLQAAKRQNLAALMQHWQPAERAQLARLLSRLAHEAAIVNTPPLKRKEVVHE